MTGHGGGSVTMTGHGGGSAMMLGHGVGQPQGGLLQLE